MKLNKPVLLFSLSLLLFQQPFVCTVPQIPTEFDHLILVVMAILICIVVAKLTNLQ